MEYFVVVYNDQYYGPFTKDEAEHVKRTIDALPSTFAFSEIKPLLVFDRTAIFK